MNSHEHQATGSTSPTTTGKIAKLTGSVGLFEVHECSGVDCHRNLPMVGRAKINGTVLPWWQRDR
jgi:hypothetical protein